MGGQAVEGGGARVRGAWAGWLFRVGCVRMWGCGGQGRLWECEGEGRLCGQSVVGRGGRRWRSSPVGRFGGAGAGAWQLAGRCTSAGTGHGSGWPHPPLVAGPGAAHSSDSPRPPPARRAGRGQKGGGRPGREAGACKAGMRARGAGPGPAPQRRGRPGGATGERGADALLSSRGALREPKHGKMARRSR